VDKLFVHFSFGKHFNNVKLQFLTDEPSFCTLRAACPSIVALIDKKDADLLIEKKPSLVFPIAYSVLQRLSSFVRAIDFALGWVLLDSGEALYRFF